MKNQTVYKRLLQYSRVYGWAILLGVIGTVIASGVDASFAWLMRPLLDKGFINKDVKFIELLPFLLILAFLLRNAANFMSNYYMAWAGRNIVNDFRKNLFAHYMKLPASFLDNTSSGQLLSKLIYNVEQVAQASTKAIVIVVQEGFFIAGLIVVMFLNSWQLSLMFLAIAPAVAFIARISSKKMRRLSQNVQQSMSSVTQITEEGLEGYREIRSFDAQDYEINRFNDIANKNRDREIHTIATNSLATSGVQLVIAILISLTVYMATAKFTHITAGTFVSIITAMLAMLKPLRNLTNVNSIIQKGIAGAESLFQTLDEPAEPDSGCKILDDQRPSKGHITFNQVSFNYPAHEKIILKEISFEIPGGKTAALVGKSGSGKSTLASLLPRFYDNFSGEIRIDNIEIRELTLKNLRAQLSIVSQQIILFNDTIRNNIAYGMQAMQNQDYENEIIDAVKAANAWEFISELPLGLDTIVGENGVLLSGGQRQRIAIARALLKNASLLILDEATSALDTESESAIQAALDNLTRNRTTLIIAHRLSTIKNADNILVMDEGRIVESGTHDKLMASNGYYVRLNQQSVKENHL